MDYFTCCIYVSFLFLLFKLFTCCNRRLKKLEIYRKHVLITGGGSGLGKEVARECFYKGAFITLISRNKTHLLETLKELEVNCNNSELGKFVQIFNTDLSKNEKFEEILKQAEHRFGPINLFISCAGTNEYGFFLESDNKIYKRLMKNNYISVVNSLLPVSKLMCSRKKGRICLVTASQCYMPIIGSSAMHASKAAVHGLADSIRDELDKYNVHLSVFSPGPIKTEGYLTAKASKPEEINSIEGTPISVEGACTELLRGISSGDKYISTHLLYRILRISSLGSAKRSNSILDILLSGISIVTCCLVSKYIEHKTKNLKIKIIN